MSNIKWDSLEYQNNFNFVSEYGKDVTSLIETKAPATLLDCGCGNGLLTRQLIEKGYQVTGVDSSKEMLELFKKNNPGTKYIYSNLLFLRVDEQYDIIFSNACFHWILKENQHQLAIRLNKALKLGGELVFEFGGYKCAYLIHSTLEKIFNRHGYDYVNEFYFPTIREHSNVLEDHGFLIKSAVLFDRPTKVETGLIGWLEMFDKKAFEGVTKEDKYEMIYELEEKLKDDLYYDDCWHIDYTRIRMRAIKIKEE